MVKEANLAVGETGAAATEAASVMAEGAKAALVAMAVVVRAPQSAELLVLVELCRIPQGLSLC